MIICHREKAETVSQLWLASLMDMWVSAATTLLQQVALQDGSYSAESLICHSASPTHPQWRCCVLCVYSLCFSQWWVTQNSQLIESNSFTVFPPCGIFCQAGLFSSEGGNKCSAQPVLCKKERGLTENHWVFSVLSWIRRDPKTQTGNQLVNKVKFKLLACNERQDNTAKKTNDELLRIRHVKRKIIKMIGLQQALWTNLIE